ncbi:hypothetical protein BSL78_19095 [Apostichopus japonicus]|uniref:Uncharacterized protein n=1 Tax=Stichopus japonicus TaxID=307972 RepID=A0A2G8K7X5_STIJA|nr:hypothetical protein BSL78_19095 [Apostichopus japonicus]
MHVHSTVHCCSTVHIELNDNGFDESIFSSLTEQDCSKMFPGKVGWAKKVMLVARTFGEPTSLLTSEQSSIRPVPTTPMPAMSAPTTSSPTPPCTNLVESDETEDAEDASTASSVNNSYSLSEDALLVDEPPSLPEDEEPEDQSEELFTKPELWPQYSDQVMGALQEGKVIEEWDKIVAETAFFVLSYSNPKKSADYSTIGRLFCEKFPCVKFQEHGKSTWVFKCIYTDTQLRVESFRSFEMFT